MDTLLSLSEHASKMGNRAIRKGINDTGWATRHFTACSFPGTVEEEAIVTLCDGIHRYATLEGMNGGDYVLGAALGHVIVGVRGLLDGQTGRLDCGTVDSWLYDVSYFIGYDLERERWTGLTSRD